MKLEQLPDLSDWRHVESVSIDEGALLWAGIDPLDHLNTRIIDLRDRVPSLQYKKALIFQRAISEGVCSGALSFVEAWELAGEWENERSVQVEPFSLPTVREISTNMTRIKLAALGKWAEKKNMISVKAQLNRDQRAAALLTMNAGKNDAVLDVEVKPVSVLALTGPSIHDQTYARYSAKLSAAVSAWLAEHEMPDGVSPKKAMTDWITERADKFGLIGTDGKPMVTAIKEAATTANWNQKGGAPKTPS